MISAVSACQSRVSEAIKHSMQWTERLTGNRTVYAYWRACKELKGFDRQCQLQYNIFISRIMDAIESKYKEFGFGRKRKFSQEAMKKALEPSPSEWFSMVEMHEFMCCFLGVNAYVVVSDDDGKTAVFVAPKHNQARSLTTIVVILPDQAHACVLASGQDIDQAFGIKRVVVGYPKVAT